MRGGGVWLVRSSGSAAGAGDGGFAASAAGVTSCVRGRKEDGGEGASACRRGERKEEVEGGAGCGVEDRAKVATARRRTRQRYCLIGIVFLLDRLTVSPGDYSLCCCHFERVLCVHVECLRKCP